jgi:hypothetical protein
LDVRGGQGLGERSLGGQRRNEAATCFTPLPRGRQCLVQEDGRRGEGRHRREGTGAVEHVRWGGPPLCAARGPSASSREPPTPICASTRWPAPRPRSFAGRCVHSSLDLSNRPSTRNPGPSWRPGRLRPVPGPGRSPPDLQCLHCSRCASRFAPPQPAFSRARPEHVFLWALAPPTSGSRGGQTSGGRRVIARGPPCPHPGCHYPVQAWPSARPPPCGLPVCPL